MARAKVTSTDIYARVARGECANYRNNACQGRTPCTVLVGENCEYFTKYVKPLLDYPEFSAKYAKEAKVTLALNPKAKVIRQRRKAEEPALDLEAVAAPIASTVKPAKSSAVKARPPAKSVPQEPALPLAAKVSVKTPATRGKAAATAVPTKAPVAAKAAHTATAGKPKKAGGEQAPVIAAQAPKSARTAPATTASRPSDASARKTATTVTVQGKVVTTAAKSAAPARKAAVASAKPAAARKATSTPVEPPMNAVPAKTRGKKTEEVPVTTTVTVSGDVLVRPAEQPRAKRLKVASSAGATHTGTPIAPTLSDKPKVEKTQLTLDMFAAVPVQRTAGKRR